MDVSFASHDYLPMGDRRSGEAIRFRGMTTTVTDLASQSIGPVQRAAQDADF